MLSSTDEAVRECIHMIEQLQGLPNNLTYNVELWIVRDPHYNNTSDIIFVQLQDLLQMKQSNKSRQSFKVCQSLDDNSDMSFELLVYLYKLYCVTI